MEAGLAFADLTSCREKVLLRRKIVEDIWERWFDGECCALGGC